MKKVLKVLACIILILGIIAAIGYVAGRFYFMDHFYPRTAINGIDVSLKTGDEALALVVDPIEKYSLTIHSADGDMKITSRESGLEYTDTEEIYTILKNQNEEMWFEEIINAGNHSLENVALDEEKLKKVVEGLSCMNPAKPQQPVDAKIEYDAVKKEFILVDEIIGNTIDKEKFYQAVKTSLLEMKDKLDLTTNEYYVQPKYFASSDVAVKAKADLDKYTATVIHYEDNGFSYDLDHEKFDEFIKVDKDFKITLDKDAIKTFVEKEISPVFNTVGKKREFNTPGSGKFTAQGGTYGWQVGLIGERDAMIKDIEAGQEVTREPYYLQDAAVKDPDNDIGDYYADVNIEKQKLWLVEKGKVIFEADFVSGKESAGRDTDKGIYMIEYKQKNYYMKENNVTVKYWMPFNVDVGEGFHDAPWRSSFGGQIYKYNGSHGCVNLAPDVAKKLYEIIKVRCPVIIH